MLSHRNFQVPDRVFFSLTGLVMALTAGFAIWAWPLMPESLPIHFGLNGQADSFSRTVMTLFLPVVIQLLLAFLISWAYRHPQYFNFPTRRRLASLPPKVQAALIVLARHMLAVLALISVLILAHLEEGIVLTGLNQTGAPDPGLLLFLLGFVFVCIGVYTGWMARIIRTGTADEHPLRG